MPRIRHIFSFSRTSKQWGYETQNYIKHFYLPFHLYILRSESIMTHEVSLSLKRLDRPVWRKWSLRFETIETSLLIGPFSAVFFSWISPIVHRLSTKLICPLHGFLWYKMYSIFCSKFYHWTFFEQLPHHQWSKISVFQKPTYFHSYEDFIQFVERVYWTDKEHNIYMTWGPRSR